MTKSLSGKNSYSQNEPLAARRIGLFDSGFGGLTVMQQIVKQLPHEELIYLGDTARLPYGNKSPATIIKYSIDNAVFLLEKRIKLLVVACNTASAHALAKLRQIFNIPLIGVIEPGAHQAVAVTRNQRIGVLGTKGTIQSGSFEAAIKQRLPQAEVFSAACPLLVHLVEEQLHDHPATRLIIRDYIKPLKAQGIDTLLLGCTHYPLLRDLIQDEIGPTVTLVDSASTCAAEVERLLKEEQLQRSAHPSPSHRFFVSDDPEKFALLGSGFLGRPISGVELAIY